MVPPPLAARWRGCILTESWQAHVGCYLSLVLVVGVVLTAQGVLAGRALAPGSETLGSMHA